VIFGLKKAIAAEDQRAGGKTGGCPRVPERLRALEQITQLSELITAARGIKAVRDEALHHETS
jgi:hypothetical protein